MKPLDKALGEAPAEVFRVNKDWTPAMLERIRTMAALGHTGSEIGAVFDVSRSAIIGLCSRRGIKLGGPVYGTVKRGSAPWPQELVDKASTLYRNNMPLRLIAEQVGRSADAIAHKMRDVGISRPAQTQRPSPARLPAAPPPAPAKAPLMTPLTGDPVRLLDARFFHCTWPVDGPESSPGGWYCGAPIAGRTWCAHHLARGTQPIRGTGHATYRLPHGNVRGMR